MRILWTATLALLALAQPACLGTPTSSCLYGGKVYAPGATFPSDDGCNTCSCEPTGDVVCTARACAPSDGGGGDGGDTVMCTGSPGVFPVFDKHCAAPADCAIALHQYNCCGSERAIGINQAERARFARDEAICRAQYPGCGCATAPTVAEDGKTSMKPGDIIVSCAAGACTTSIP